LPPYHPDLNAIENIWGDVKQCVGQRNVTFKLDDVWQLCEQRFAEISDMEWAAVCRHVMSVEEQYIHTEGLMEPEVERPMFSVSGRSKVGIVRRRTQEVTQQWMSFPPVLTRMMHWTVSRHSNNLLSAYR
jgi:hypothetical protein